MLRPGIIHFIFPNGTQRYYSFSLRFFRREGARQGYMEHASGIDNKFYFVIWFLLFFPSQQNDIPGRYAECLDIPQ